MNADFFFDTICPWCHVGKARFERAISLRPDLGLQIRWRPFILNPEMPPEGMDRKLYLERKFGGPTRVQRLFNSVRIAAKSEGIVFDFDRIQKSPNSLHSHRLIRFAEPFGCARQVVDAVFDGYFRLGRDIGMIEELITIGVECGLTEMDLAAYLYSDEDVALLMNENARAHRLGVTGVPCIILDDRYAVAGAQELDVILRLLDLARENEPEPVGS